MTVGSSHPPGTAEDVGNKNLPSGPKIVDWMMDNKQWIDDNTLVAFYLLPQLNDPNFSAQGFRDQVRTGLREHKTASEFYADARYAVAMREYWARVDAKNAAIARGADKSTEYDRFDLWEKDWKIAHPATSMEKSLRENPDWVHGKLAPSLKKLVESGNAPAGVQIDAARQVWQHYSDYREKYNNVTTEDQGKYDRAHINKVYREDGDRKFLGTPAENLWKAMDVYEGYN